MTALSIVQTAASWLALPQPTTLFGANLDPQTTQLVSLLNLEEVEQWSVGDLWWRKVLKQWTFTSTATDIQPTNATPPDLGYIIANTMWDRTITRPIVGPLSPETWQAWKARPVLTSVLYGFMLQGNDFYTAPNPPAGDTVAYNYISNLSVYAVGDIIPTKQFFTADTDTSAFNETMLEMGVRWRFLRAKGLDYAQEYKDWSDMRQRFGARDKSMPTISAAGPQWPALSGPYIPSFNFPG